MVTYIPTLCAIKMSIPRNHHYVSQCHQKGFFNQNNGKIYLYDKEINNFYERNSSKGIFSGRDLNSRANFGIIDHKSLEDELKILEDKFPSHLKIIKDFIEVQNNIEEAYHSLGWMTALGIIGEMRNPQFKRKLDDTLDEITSRVFTDASEEFKKLYELNRLTPYSNVVGYIELAQNILDRMQPLKYVIFVIKSDDCFLLPDTSCYQVRGQIKQYINPHIMEIVEVGIPITDKIFVVSTPQINSPAGGINFINEDNSETVYRINKNLYCFAKKTVACSNQNYLKCIVNKINLDGI